MDICYTFFVSQGPIIKMDIFWEEFSVVRYWSRIARLTFSLITHFGKQKSKSKVSNKKVFHSVLTEKPK